MPYRHQVGLIFSYFVSHVCSYVTSDLSFSSYAISTLIQTPCSICGVFVAVHYICWSLHEHQTCIDRLVLAMIAFEGQSLPRGEEERRFAEISLTNFVRHTLPCSADHSIMELIFSGNLSNNLPHSSRETSVTWARVHWWWLGNQYVHHIWWF